MQVLNSRYPKRLGTSFMKLILSGLGPGTDLEKLRERMSHFGPVGEINAIREGDPERPWFIVHIDISPAAGAAVARRIDGLHFQGRFLHAHTLLPID